MNEAVNDKQLGGVGNDEDGRGRLTRCLSPGARYPCYALGTLTLMSEPRNSQISSNPRHSEKRLENETSTLILHACEYGTVRLDL